MTIRRLHPDDWQTLREVRLRALADAPEAFGSTHAREAEYDETRWRELLADSAWFVAIGSESPVGVVAGFQPDGRPQTQRDLVAMWVATQARGSGVARELVEAVIGWARADGATDLLLGVADGNVRAEALYRKVGFVPTGERVPLRRGASQEMEIYRLGIERK